MIVCCAAVLLSIFEALSIKIHNEKLVLCRVLDFPAQYEQLRKFHLCD